jgi:hypothetical protein
VQTYGNFMMLGVPTTRNIGEEAHKYLERGVANFAYDASAALGTTLSSATFSVNYTKCTGTGHDSLDEISHGSLSIAIVHL